MAVDYLEKCEAEAEEYADIVESSGSGITYDDAYNHYMNKCIRNRKEKDEEPHEIDFN
jgi:hypothetical protein